LLCCRGFGWRVWLGSGFGPDM